MGPARQRRLAFRNPFAGPQVSFRRNMTDMSYKKEMLILEHLVLNSFVFTTLPRSNRRPFGMGALSRWSLHTLFRVLQLSARSSRKEGGRNIFAQVRCFAVGARGPRPNGKFLTAPRVVSPRPPRVAQKQPERQTRPRLVGTRH